MHITKSISILIIKILRFENNLETFTTLMFVIFLQIHHDNNFNGVFLCVFYFYEILSNFFVPLAKKIFQKGIFYYPKLDIFKRNSRTDLLNFIFSSKATL